MRFVKVQSRQHRDRGPIRAEPECGDEQPTALAWKEANVEHEVKGDFVAVDHDISYGAACSVSVVSRAVSNEHDYPSVDWDSVQHQPD